MLSGMRLYLTEIIEAIKEKRCFANYLSSDHRFITPARRTAFLEKLPLAQKFYGGRIEELPNSEVDSTSFHLPFNSCYFEFDHQIYHQVTQKEKPMWWHGSGWTQASKLVSSRWCCLCENIPETFETPESLRQPYAGSYFKELRFVISPFEVLKFSSGEVMVEDLSMLIYAGIDQEDFPFFRFVRTAGCDQTLFEGGKELAKYLDGCIGTFLSILSCSNIGTLEHRAEEKLNKARLRRGQTPFFQFKTLTIRSFRTTGNTVEVLDTDRKKPCLHWRRGHVRTYQSGKKIWIQQMIVGSEKEGVMVKDYTVQVSKTI